MSDIVGGQIKYRIMGQKCDREVKVLDINDGAASADGVKLIFMAVNARLQSKCRKVSMSR